MTCCGRSIRSEAAAGAFPGISGRSGRACITISSQCDAPCQEYISKEDYRKNVSGALSFLGGNYKEVTAMLQEKMMEFSEAMDFEKAIEYRDLLNSVKQISQKQKITSSHMDDRNVIGFAKAADEAVVQAFLFVQGSLSAATIFT